MFTATKKQKFIELAETHFPDVSKVCKEIGISFTCYREHLIVDAKFRECIDEIRQAKVDNVEGNMFIFSQRPANFMDRMAILRAYRGGLFNPVNKIQHVGGAELSAEDALRRKVELATVVDAEVVNASSEVLEAEVVSPEPIYNKNAYETPAEQPTRPAPVPEEKAQEPVNDDIPVIMPRESVVLKAATEDPIAIKLANDKREYYQKSKIRVQKFYREKKLRKEMGK